MLDCLCPACENGTATIESISSELDTVYCRSSKVRNIKISGLSVLIEVVIICLIRTSEAFVLFIHFHFASSCEHRAKIQPVASETNNRARVSMGGLVFICGISQRRTQVINVSFGNVVPFSCSCLSVVKFRR